MGERKVMNVYFDSEFTGLVPETTLISLGMIAENGAVFYAEFTDYNPHMCDDWVKENVLKNLIFDSDDDTDQFRKARKKLGVPEGDHNSCVCRGPAPLIRKMLEFWFTDTLGDYDIQLVGDVCYYDMVLLCNLFGGSFGLPKNVCPAPIDICMLIKYDADLFCYDSSANTMRYAFNISRDDLCECLYGDTYENIHCIGGSQHNALHNAAMMLTIYHYIGHNTLYDKFNKLPN